jgi:hypothetical protein
MPEVQGINEAVLKGLGRPQARGFLNSVFRSLTSVELRTPAGIYLGKAPGFNVNLARLNRVVRRIVTGLFYRERDTRLPDGYVAFAYAEDGLRELDKAKRDQLRTWCARAQARPGWSIGGSVFSYWFTPGDDDPFTSVWAFVFYQRVNFIGLTAPTGPILRPRDNGPTASEGPEPSLPHA